MAVICFYGSKGSKMYPNLSTYFDTDSHGTNFRKKINPKKQTFDILQNFVHSIILNNHTFSKLKLNSVLNGSLSLHSHLYSFPTLWFSFVGKDAPFRITIKSENICTLYYKYTS